MLLLFHVVCSAGNHTYHDTDHEDGHPWESACRISGDSPMTWFMDIGLWYPVIPIMAVGFGYALRDAAENTE
jgi:hypothetical protein